MINSEEVEKLPPIARDSSVEFERLVDLQDSDYLDGCDCKPKVLVVDDNQFNILALKSTILDNFDVEVHEAGNGLIAVEMYTEAFNKKCNCNNRLYKLIFMDI